MKRFIASLLALSIVWLGALFLSWQGYGLLQGCDGGRRIESDEEKIAYAISRVLASYPPAISHYETAPDGRLELSLFRPEKFIPYSSTGQFLRSNRNCCAVTTKERGDFGNEGKEISFFTKLLGFKSSNVRVRYLVSYINSENEMVSEEIEQYISIPICLFNN